MQCNGTISDLVQTTRDLELQGHATLQVTFAISGTIHVRAMIFFVSRVSQVVQCNGTISDLVQTTRDLELQGHATLQVAFAISGTIHARAMIFVVFRVSEVDGITTRCVTCNNTVHFCIINAYFIQGSIDSLWGLHVLQYLVRIILVPWYHGTNTPIGYRPNMRLKSRGNKQIANVG